MALKGLRSGIQLLVLGAVAVILLMCLFPIFGLSKSGLIINWHNINTDGQLEAALGRTLSYAFCSSFLNVTLAFCLALLLKQYKLRSAMSKWLSMLIFPLLLGNTAFVFMAKVLLFNSSVFSFILSKGFLLQLIFSLLVGFWQYGLLFTYLFWLALNKLPLPKMQYVNAIKLTPFEILRDVLLPHCRNLILLLLLINFLTSFYDDSKSQLLFYSSVGMNNELLNHWLNRIHQSYEIIFPVKAVLLSQVRGLLLSLFILCAAVALLFGMRYFLSKVNRILPFSSVKIYQSKEINSNWIKVCIMLITIVPVVLTLTRLFAHHFGAVWILGKSLMLTCLVAVLSSLFAAFSTAYLRLKNIESLNGMYVKSFYILLSLFIIQIVPPICVTLASFKWMSWIGYSSLFLVHIFWILNHILMSFPILGSFLLVTHFGVRSTELHYLKAYHLSSRRILWFSFLKRYQGEYIFTVIFAFAYIWNDTKINLVFSDYVPSYVSNLLVLISGKSVNYNQAISFFLVGLCLAVTCILIWNTVLLRRERVGSDG